jgi:hypothetical protein
VRGLWGRPPFFHLSIRSNDYWGAGAYLIEARALNNERSETTRGILCGSPECRRPTEPVVLGWTASIRGELNRNNVVDATIKHGMACAQRPVAPISCELARRGNA